MPISVLTANFYDGPIDSALTLFADPYYYNSYSGSGTTVIDLSGDNDGILNNVTFDNELGGCFLFGANSYIDFPNNGNFYQTGDLTICVLVKPTSLISSSIDGYPIIAIEGASDGSNYISLAYGSSSYKGKFYWIQRSGTTGPVSVPFNNSNTPINNWYFVSVVRSESSGTTKLYVNGELDSEFATVSTGGLSLNLRIGSTKFRPTPLQFNGKLAQVRIFTRTLDELEIKNIYNNLRLSPNLLGTTNYTYDMSYNLPIESDKVLHVDAGNPDSYYLRGLTFSDLSGNNLSGKLTYSFIGTYSTFEKFFGGNFYSEGFSQFNPVGNSYIEFNADTLPSGSLTCSIITWAKSEQFSQNNRYIFSYGNPGDGQARYLGVNTSGKYIIGGFGGLAELQSNIGVSFSQWFQLSFIYDGSKMYLYVNGTLDNSLTYNLSTVTTSKKARIARQITNTAANVTPVSADGYWYGRISEVIVYDRALDAQEIYQDYKIKRYRYNLPEVERPTTVITPTIPTVTTDAYSDVTLSSATVTFTITSTGYSIILDSGVVYSFVQNPTISGTKTTGGSTSLTGLIPNTLYYVRAYATNQQGTAYGNELSFTTVGIVIPTVSSVTASSTSATSIVATASIDNLGGAANVTQVGFVYSTSTFTEAQAPSILTKVSQSGSYGLGKYKLDITNLAVNTLYYIRGFAVNSAGTDYTNDITSVRTLTLATVTVPVLISVTDVQIIAEITTSGLGRIEQGIIYKTTLGDPNILGDNDVVAPFTTNTSQHTIDGLTLGQTYYLWGYVKNNGGIEYSTTSLQVTTANVPVVNTVEVTQISTNYSFTGELVTGNNSFVSVAGFVVGRKSVYTNFESVTITINDFIEQSVIGEFPDGILETFFSSVAAMVLQVGVPYWVRAYATNSVGTSYGDGLEFTLVGTPQVSTSVPAATANPQVYQLIGNVSNMGSSTTLEVGFYFGTGNPPSTKLTPNAGARTGVGEFSQNTVTLNIGTTYYLKAYARNNTFGIEGEGFIRQITVSNPVPTLQTTAPLDLIYTSSFVMQMTATNITSAQSVTTRGFVWNVSSSPTVALTTKTDNGTGTTNFSTIIPTDMVSSTPLVASTDYYIRAYATNASGTGYSNEIRIYTAQVQFFQNPFIDTSNRVVYSAELVQAPQAAGSVSNRGAVWSTSTITETRLRNADGTLNYTDGANAGTGQWGVVTNTDNGGILVGSPVNGTTYYVRPWVQLSSTYGNVKVYGRERSVLYTASAGPTVTLSTTNLYIAALFINNFEVNVVDNGSAVTERGLVFSNLNTSPQTSGANNTKVAFGTSGAGSFTQNLTGLNVGTNYYVRAYAVNANGTSYHAPTGVLVKTLDIVFQQNPSNTLQRRKDPIFQESSDSYLFGWDVRFYGLTPNTSYQCGIMASLSPTQGYNGSEATSTSNVVSNSSGQILLPGVGLTDWFLSIPSMLALSRINKVWYLRAYIVKGSNPEYSNQITIFLPEIRHANITPVSPTTGTVPRTLRGQISSTLGGLSIVSRGFKTDLNFADPYIDNNTPASVDNPVAGTSTGLYTFNFGIIPPGNFLRSVAYVRLSNGITYFSDGAFTIG